MSKVENNDTRYFVEVDLSSLKLVRCAYDQKENLDKGKQNDPQLHRLFLTKGQYRKFVERCGDQLADIIES